MKNLKKQFCKLNFVKVFRNSMAVLGTVLLGLAFLILNFGTHPHDIFVSSCMIMFFAQSTNAFFNAFLAIRYENQLNKIGEST